MLHPARYAVLLPLSLGALLGCSSDVVVDDGGGGGAGGATATANASSTTNAATTNAATTNAATTNAATTSVTTGQGPCDEHADCPGGVCVFSQGVCQPACAALTCDTCSPGTVCDACATSSGPMLGDCVAACMPKQIGQCDENDPCPQGETCMWGQNVCAPLCTMDGCADPNLVCVGCATGSCCGCDDCVDVCLAVDG